MERILIYLVILEVILGISALPVTKEFLVRRYKRYTADNDAIIFDFDEYLKRRSTTQSPIRYNQQNWSQKSSTTTTTTRRPVINDNVVFFTDNVDSEESHINDRRVLYVPCPPGTYKIRNRCRRVQIGYK